MHVHIFQVMQPDLFMKQKKINIINFFLKILVRAVTCPKKKKKKERKTKQKKKE